MTSEVRVFQRKSSVDQSQTWTVTFRNGARESMSVGSNGMTGGLWTIDAVENDDDPNDVTRWVEVFHHSPQQPAPVEEVIRYPREFVRVRNCNSPGWQLYIVDAPGARPRSTLPGLWSGTYRTEESLLAVVNRGDYIEITNQRPRTPAPVETSAAPSQPADVPQWCRDAAREFLDIKPMQPMHPSAERVVAQQQDELAAIVARHAAPVFKELALKRDEYIDVLRKQVDASAAELTTLRERLAGVEGRIAAVREIVEQVKLSALKQADYEYAATMLNLRDCLDHGNAIDLDRLATLLPSAGRFVSIRAREKQIDELHERVKFFDEELNDTTALRADLARAKDALINIGSFFGCSAHLPWFSDDACDEVSAMIDEKGGEKRYDPAFYETYCAQVIADIVTGALSASASGEEADNAELR